MYDPLTDTHDHITRAVEALITGADLGRLHPGIAGCGTAG